MADAKFSESEVAMAERELVKAGVSAVDVHAAAQVALQLAAAEIGEDRG